MDPSDVNDVAGFSSFFFDYKHPNMTNSYYSYNTEELSLQRQPFSTPPASSAAAPSVSASSLNPNVSIFPNVLTPAQATRTLVLKRKLFDNNQEALKAAIASITPDERTDLEEIENFAAFFKKQRMQFGCTQNDIGVALGKKYGTEFSQTTISRFEALNLSFKNMCKLRPLLKEWLDEVDYALSQGITINEFLKRTPPGTEATFVKKPSGKLKKNEGRTDGRHRKRRTFIDENQSVQLAVEYSKQPRPSSNYLNELSDRLGLEKNVIRIWYSNHRQKIRKLEDERITIQMNPSQIDQKVHLHVLSKQYETQ